MAWLPEWFRVQSDHLFLELVSSGGVPITIGINKLFRYKLLGRTNCVRLRHASIRSPDMFVLKTQKWLRKHRPRVGYADQHQHGTNELFRGTLSIKQVRVLEWLRTHAAYGSNKTATVPLRRSIFDFGACASQGANELNCQRFCRLFHTNPDGLFCMMSRLYK
jgi:hypothetical protein